MRVLKTVSLGVALLAMTACSGAGGGGGGGGAAGPAGVTPLAHNSSECPQLSGRYEKVISANETHGKEIKSSAIPSGVSFEDTGVKWQIDGTKKIVEGAPQYSYTGVCSQKSIVIDFFEDSKQMARFSYLLNQSGQLVVELTALDPEIGKSEKEVYDRKN
jgi:hypothetical protein